MGALLQPRPDLGAGLFHLVLHVDFLAGDIAREGEGELRERSLGLQRDELLLVEEIAPAPLFAEEEPAFALRARGLAVLQERAERRDACAWPDHDHGRVAILG